VIKITNWYKQFTAEVGSKKDRVSLPVRCSCFIAKFIADIHQYAR